MSHFLIHCVILQVPYGEVMTKTLVFAVYDYDRFSKHDAIGEVRLPVCQMDLAQAKEIWKELQSIVGDGKVSGYFSRSCCCRYISANLSAARNFFFNLLQQKSHFLAALQFTHTEAEAWTCLQSQPLCLSVFDVTFTMYSVQKV